MLKCFNAIACFFPPLTIVQERYEDLVDILFIALHLALSEKLPTSQILWSVEASSTGTVQSCQLRDALELMPIKLKSCIPLHLGGQGEGEAVLVSE